MKIKILKYLSTFLTVLLLISCNDSFLDHKPLAKASEETFYSTMQAADQAVTACYSDFCLEKDWDLTIMMTSAVYLPMKLKQVQAVKPMSRNISMWTS